MVIIYCSNCKAIKLPFILPLNPNLKITPIFLRKNSLGPSEDVCLSYHSVLFPLGLEVYFLFFLKKNKPMANW